MILNFGATEYVNTSSDEVASGKDTPAAPPASTPTPILLRFLIVLAVAPAQRQVELRSEVNRAADESRDLLVLRMQGQIAHVSPSIGTSGGTESSSVPGVTASIC